MNCNETDNQECLIRHKRLDDTEKMITQMYEVVCGGIHPENSLSTKVDEMYRENQGMKNFIKGCVVALITLIFWCGYQFATLQNCVQRIEKMEVKIGQLSK